MSTSKPAQVAVDCAVFGITVAGAPIGEHAQSGEQTHTTFCVMVNAIVSVEVTGLDEETDVVEDEDGEIVELDLLVALLADVGITDAVDDGGIVVVDREVVELVVDLAVVGIELVGTGEEDDEDEDVPGAFPTIDPTHAFQFVMPSRQVVEMG